jgi:hypothetical protein
MQSVKLKQLSTMIVLVLACQGAWASDADTGPAPSCAPL